MIRAYERQNLLDVAEDALEKAEATVGKNSKIDAIAARVCLRRGNPEEARKRLESINWEELDSNTYQTTLFVAGDIYERLKEVDKAMHAYQEANLRQSQTSRALMYDKRNNLAEYETCCKAYTHEFVKGWPKPTHERFKKDPIFFVGFPRSGTTPRSPAGCPDGPPPG